MKKFSTQLLFVLTVIISILIIGFIHKNQYEFIINAIVIYSVCICVLYCEKKGFIIISKLVKSLAFVVIFLHLAGGQYLELYETNGYFDKGLHLIGSFAFALFMYQAVAALAGVEFYSKILVFTIISSLGISLGVLLEILEFSLDVILKSNHQKGLSDTNLDMIFNIIGASLAGLSKMKSEFYKQ